ncbi:MAG TPA: AAA family ATPase [Candidatus Paceibacterota bacterium]|nr:AAA family ATPase [Candidatus Paceibacterota bacterium]
MKLVIGITGAPLAGKETAANIIAELIQKDGHTVSRHRFSDILRDTLDLWGLPHGRINEQNMAQLMIVPQFFGKNTLSNAMKARLKRDATDVGVIDGVRWFSDEDMIMKDLPRDGVKGLIVYVDADPDIRFKRLQIRQRAGEAHTTREEFDMQGKRENEIYIAEIGNRAQIKLLNNYDSVDDFKNDVIMEYEKNIKPLL